MKKWITMRRASRRRVVKEVFAITFMALITIVSAVVNASAVPLVEMRWHVENKREFDLPGRASPDAIGISCRETAKLAGVI